MIDWPTIENTVVATIATASGLAASSVRWAAPNAAIPARPCIALDWLVRDQDVGNPARNEQRLTATPGTAQIKHWRRHVLTVDYLAELPATPSDASSHATAAIGKVARALQTSGVRATLQAAGLAIVTIGDPRNISEFVGERFETRAVLEIDLQTCDATADAVGQIATVTGPTGP